MVDKNMKAAEYADANGNVVEFGFYESPSVLRKAAFVSSVVNSVIVGGDYYKLLTDLMFDYQLIASFTDIDIKKIVVDAGYSDIDVGTVEYVIETHGNAVNVVKDGIDEYVLAELIDSVRSAVEYRTGIHVNVLEDAIASFLDTIEKKIEGFDTDKLADAAMAINGISGDLNPTNLINAFVESDSFRERATRQIPKLSDEVVDKIRDILNENSDVATNKVVAEDAHDNVDVIDDIVES